MGKNNTYWNGLEQYHAKPEYTEAVKDEFKEELPIAETFSEEKMGLSTNRRDFLKIFGFGLTAAALTACVDKPVRKAIPYVIKPNEVTPGVPSWYASTCSGCSGGCGVLVKSREGRPIKMEGNPEHKLNKGGLCSAGHASVLELYDSHRIKGPRGRKGKKTWEVVDNEIGQKIKSARKVAVVTNTICSISSKKAIDQFLAQFPQGKHIQYDPISNYALAKVHTQPGAKWMSVPGYHFEDAEVIVSFEADFLGAWISAPEYTKGWSKMRDLDPENPRMSRHIQFESRMTITGSNADLRIPMKPTRMMGALVKLYNEIKGGSSDGYNGPGNAVSRAAKVLKKAKGKSIVVCGINNVEAQLIVKAINEELRNYGKTMDMDNPSYQVQGNDEEMMQFVKEASSYDMVIFPDDTNPVYDYMQGPELAKALAKVETIYIGLKDSETSSICNYVLGQHHGLEAWGDSHSRKTYYGIRQPLIRPLFDTRQWEECLLKWSGDDRSPYQFVQDNWKVIHNTGGTFKDFWEHAVRTGFFESGIQPFSSIVDPVDAHTAAYLVNEEFFGRSEGNGHHADAGHHAKPEHHGEGHDAPAEDHGEGHAAVADHGEGNEHHGGDHEEGGEETAVVVSDRVSPAAASKAMRFLIEAYKGGEGGGFQLVTYQTDAIGIGKGANNPWLQELPHPITKVTWDNYITVPYTYAMEQGWEDGMTLKLVANGASVVGPLVIQPGQADGTITISVGYGRGEMTGKVGAGVGVNAYPFVDNDGTCFSYHGAKASVEATGDKVALAKTQTFIGYEIGDQRETIEDRVSDYIVKETTLSDYRENRAAGNKRPSSHHMISLWDVHDKKGHHWAMAIDLNKCTGCGSCIVSCNAENNIPVVGKQEVLVRREMHWMRIDRYYKGDPGDQTGKLETLFQPMMCQHCDNAPCETVCPVLATVHSDEGLNQQVYNRCIGTRYCANNCPYKVRRFNWFSYYWNDDYKDVNYMSRDKIGRLVLNPDVTVRARGVMEKCSFCVQRIQEKKLKAKTEKRKLKDSDISLACQQSCPSDAVVFGDLNDETSRIHKLYRYNMRGYHALEEVKTLPSVMYMTKVRNKDGLQDPITEGGDHT